MEKEIKSFIAEVMENTGIDFSVYTQAGELLAGQDVILDKTNLDADGVKVDEQNAQTLFALKFKGKKFIGCINGATNIESNYAFLISKLCENLYFKDTGLNKQEFLKMALFGEIGQAQIYKYMRKFSIKDQPVYAMLISVEKEFIEDVKNVLSSSADGNDFVATTDDEQVAFAKFVDESLPEYQSPTEYAEFIKQMVYEETGTYCKIAIGSTVKGLGSLSLSYAQALSTQALQQTLGARGDVHTFKEFLLIKMLEDLPKYKLNENLDALMDSGAKEIFSDEEMLETAEEFLENSLNTSETSRKLYLHRNTLIYRLDKIERGTGLNIRKFSDAVTFRLITILSRLTK